MKRFLDLFKKLEKTNQAKKQYENAMKETSVQNRLRYGIIAFCHLIIILMFYLQAKPSMPILLSIGAFILKWSDYDIFMLFKAMEWRQLSEQLLLTKECAVIVLTILHHQTSHLDKNWCFLSFMIGYGLIENQKAFPKKFFRFALLIFLVIEHVFIFIKMYTNLEINIMALLLVWVFFSMTFVVS